MSTPEDFNPHQPLKTRGNWPARLLGVVAHTQFPLVVAVTNPAFDREEVYFYALDGQSFTQREYADGSVNAVHTGPLALTNYGPFVELSDSNFERVNKPTDFIQPSIEHLGKMDLSKSANPFHYDLGSMGTNLARDIVPLHEGYDSKENPYACTRLDVYNCRSGQVFRIHMKQHMTLAAKNKLAPR